MTLEETINAELKTAMLNKNEPALRGLRAVKQAILLAKTSGGGTISPEEEMKMLQKLIKQRKESVDIYRGQNREDLAKTELEEIAVIEKFLPQQMSEEQIRKELTGMLEQNGAKTPADMGRMMGMASKHFAGKADNKVVSQILKQLLGS
jgi:uncharacterized protein YqeY